MFWRKLVVITFLLICGSSTAWAQFGPTSKYEVTPFFGTKFGGKIDLSAQNPFVDYVKIKSSEDYGALFDYNFWDTFQLEFMWDRQPTNLTAHNISTGTFTKLTNSSIDMYQWGIVYMFRDPSAKLRPFAAGSLGFTHFGNANSYVGFSNKFSYTLGGGVKYFFNQHLGARLDVRWAPSRTTSSIGTVCNSFYGCYQARITNHAEQGMANLGIVLRF